MPAVLHSAATLSTEARHTARLTLRPYSLADTADFFSLLDNNRNRLQASFPTRVATTSTPAAATRVLASFFEDWRTGRLYVFGIWCSATGHYLGDISLRPTYGRHLTAEVGYYLDRAAEGYGYAREALAAAVLFGFTELHAQRLIIRCRAGNHRSCAVAEANGFQQLPVRPRLWPLRQSEAERDILYYSRTAPAVF